MVGGRQRGHRAARGALVALAVLAACDGAVKPTESSTLVFDRLLDGNRDIYRSALDGSGLTRLTDDGGDDQHPTSGGGTVVFTSFRSGNGELYAMPAGGGSVRRLTTTAAYELEPALSKDGSRLAFSSDVSGTPKLWMASPDGSNARRLTEGFGFDGSIEASPTWSPGGERVAFVATNSGNADIYALTIGGTFSVLVSGPSADVEPAWSPDGTEVAFVSNRDGDDEIYLVNVGSGQVRRMTNRTGIDAQPAWMPDGKLVYTAWVDGVPRPRWLDPAAPATVTDVGVMTGAQHPAGVF